MKQLYLNTTNNYEKTEIFRIILKTFGLPNVNPVLEESIKSRNTNNIINTIYTRFVLKCGSGKKYKQCCGK